MKSSQFILLTMEALAPKCSERNAKLYCSTTLREALVALYDGPAGLVVAIVPGDEGADVEAAVDEMQVVQPELSVVVSHRLPPTAHPNQALYEDVAGMPPFLDLVDEIRDAVRSMRLPAGETGQIWRYAGRRRVEIDGQDMPAFRLDFAIDAALPAAAEDDAETDLAPAQPFESP